MATRGLPHYWTPDQMKIILDAVPAGLPWLFVWLLWRTALCQAGGLDTEWRDLHFAGAQPSVTDRNGKGGKYRTVPAHPELVDVFRSVTYRGLIDKVFTRRGGKPPSAKTAARWICDGITNAGLQPPATRPAPKDLPPTAFATAAPDTSYSPAGTLTPFRHGWATAAQR